MNRLPILNDHELHGVLLNALHCAAAKYRDDAKALREADGHARLAKHFDRQALEADALADKLEEQSLDVEKIAGLER